MAVLVRRAGQQDVPQVLELVAGMFSDLGSPEVDSSWRAAAAAALASRAGRDVEVFVTVDAGTVVAVAVGVIDQRLPSPRRPDGRIGYLEWVATGASHRRRGAAQMAVTALLGWFDALNVPVVDVHASTSAAPLYASLGFVAPAAEPLRRAAP